MTVLAIIGLVIGLVVLLVVIKLLNDTLTPLRAILADVQGASTAPLLTRGVTGTDQLAQTQRLAESVPDLAGRYLQKLGLAVNTATPSRSYDAPPAGAPAPAPYASAPVAAPAGAVATAPEPAKPDSSWQPPAWHKYRS